MRPAHTFDSPSDSETEVFNRLEELNPQNCEVSLDCDSVDRIFPFLKHLPIPIVKKFTNYSVKGIKELPRSSGLPPDEVATANGESNSAVNGESSDVENNNCSLSPQLGTKERELQVALQKQERYQSTVQDVTARMERVQQKLMNLGTSPFKNLDQQVRDQKVILLVTFLVHRNINI